MRPRILSARPSVTRTSRNDPRGAALESVASEFALLAQRRARIARQLDLLGRQFNAAQSSLDAVHARMAWLASRIDGIDPSLRPVLDPAPPLPPTYAQPATYPGPTRGTPHQASQAASSAYATMAPAPKPPHPAPHVLQVPRAKRQMPRRRPFPPA
jgi:hypothetical protein